MNKTMISNGNQNEWRSGYNLHETVEKYQN